MIDIGVDSILDFIFKNNYNLTKILIFMSLPSHKRAHLPKQTCEKKVLIRVLLYILVNESTTSTTSHHYLHFTTSTTKMNTKNT